MKTFNVKVFLGLTQESQEKVELIYAIACELKSLGKPQLTVKDFDTLYDLPLGQLRLYTAVTTSQIHRHPAMDFPD